MDGEIERETELEGWLSEGKWKNIVIITIPSLSSVYQELNVLVHLSPSWVQFSLMALNHTALVPARPIIPVHQK